MSQDTLAAINDLQPIAHRLRDRQEQIDKGKQHLCENIAELTSLAYEQGRDIILAKTKTGKTIKFSEWLHIHVPTLQLSQAGKYERVATEQLTDPRQCIFAFLPEADVKKLLPARCKPAPWEVGWGFAHRLHSLAAATPICDWPTQQRDYLAQELEPLARELWPARFAGPPATLT